jgi:hypothetical protein
MASVFSALAPTLFAAAQEVAAEPFGIVDGLNTSFSDKGVARGDSVTIPVTPVSTNAPFTPAAASSEGTSKTAESVSVTISKSQKNSHVLTGEQIRSLENGGNYEEWVRQWSAQAMRALRNEAEVDAALAVKQGASRAYGTAGATPFSTSLAELAGARKILRDNGAPMADLQLVVNTDAELNLLNLNIIQQAFAAGTDQQLRTGVLARQMGFAIKASAGIATHAKGTATGIDVNFGAGYNIGDRTIVVHGSDSGTVLAGDVLTWAGDTNKYIVASASVSGAASGDVVLNRPGLRATLADAVEATLGANYTPNLAFERAAVVGVMRPPLIPVNPTIKQQLVSDGKGMTYLFLEIAQYGEISWEMHLAWGFKVIQPEFVAILLG